MERTLKDSRKIKFSYRYGAGQLICILTGLLIFVSCSNQQKEENTDIEQGCSDLTNHLEILESVVFRDAKLTYPVEQLLEQISINLEDCSDSSIRTKAFMLVGNYHYSSGNLDQAIDFFKLAEKNYPLSLSSPNLGALKSNLGAVYLRKGYYKTAVQYFIQARDIYEKFAVRDENYWIIRINEAVAHMDRSDFHLAIDVLNAIDTTYSESINFLTQLNLAKFNGLQKNIPGFNYHIARADNLINSAPIYKDVLNEVKLEFGLMLNQKEMLEKMTTQTQSNYWDTYSALKLLIQRARLALGKGLIGGKSEYFALEKQVRIENNLADLELLSELKFQLYADSANRKLVKVIDERDSIKELIVTETKTKNLKDFYEYNKLNELSDELNDLQTKNQLIELQSSNKNYIIGFISVSLVFILTMFFLLNRIQKKKAEITESEINHTRQMLELTRKRELELQQTLLNQSNRIDQSIRYVKKIEVLKKHIDTFLQEIESGIQPEKKPLFIKLKSNLLSFFSNYSNLAILGAQRDEKAVDPARIKITLPADTTDKELEIIQFILQDFTNKEIAVLIGKSEKTVEYYRKKLREKMEIPTEKELGEFLRNVINDPKNSLRIA